MIARVHSYSSILDLVVVGMVAEPHSSATVVAEDDAEVVEAARSVVVVPAAFATVVEIPMTGPEVALEVAPSGGYQCYLPYPPPIQ